MELLIIAMGILLVLVSIIVLVNSTNILNYLATRIDKAYVYVAAILSRLVIGALLIGLSVSASHPLAVKALGIIAVIGGLFLAFIGRQRFQKLFLWIFKMNSLVVRSGGILGIIFGAFIVYEFT